MGTREHGERERRKLKKNNNKKSSKRTVSWNTSRILTRFSASFIRIVPGAYMRRFECSEMASLKKKK